MTIVVLKPGLLSTFQDIGRHGSQKYGVIASGAMDSFAHQSANLLVGNSETEASLEMTVLGPTLYFDSSCLISLCGANMVPTIKSVPVPMWRPVYIRAGATLTLGASRAGCRCYLAVAGGFDLALEMNSYSTYLRAGIGGLHGRALQEGDRLNSKTPSALANKIVAKLSASAGDEPFSASNWFVSYEMMPQYQQNPTVRVIEGPQFSWFDQETIAIFLANEFRVQPQSDRMGYRLVGPSLTSATTQELLSEAVTFGTVQVPQDGNPIVLMADRQTTGGYPKIAQVVTVDLPKLAQCQIGSRVRFELVTLREAQIENLIRHEDLELLQKGIELHCL